MHKTVRLSKDQVDNIERLSKQLGFSNFSKTLKFLLDSSLDSRSFDDRKLFEQSLEKIHNNIAAINKIGVLLNQFVALTARGHLDRKTYARKLKLMTKRISKLDSILKKNLSVLIELSNNIRMGA